MARGHALAPTTEARRALLHALLEQGWSPETIARELGYSRSTIHKEKVVLRGGCRPEEIEPGRSVPAHWDSWLYEPWAERKARRARERAADGGEARA